MIPSTLQVVYSWYLSLWCDASYFEKFSCAPEILFNLVLFDHIYPTPPLGQDMTQGQFLKQSFTGLNLEFSFS